VEREDVALMQVTINRPIIERDAELLEALRRRDASAAERLAAMFAWIGWPSALPATARMPKKPCRTPS
jgi:hypothetical protein